MVINLHKPEVFYPERDGKRMADNTLQFQWIVTIEGGLDALFRNDPNVFVAGDLLWYPVEGSNRIRQAPDAMVVFGRPKGYRGSYLQWKEDNIAPQAVFEVWSPGNRRAEMERKRAWYEAYGVEEYYEYDPDRGKLWGWQRVEGRLVPIEAMQGWLSPRLGITFGLAEKDLELRGPDGRRFESYVEIVASRDAERVSREEEQRQKEAALQRAEQERSQKEAALQQAEQERSQKEAALIRADRLAARLRELGLSED